MTTKPDTMPPFVPKPASESGVVSWVHLGDLHMLRAGADNHRDLLAIIDTINTVFAPGLSFAFLPGDIADDGSREAFAVVREALATLALPWCGIVGDHDVHERSFANFIDAIAPATRGAFTVGDVRFLRINAFDIPAPDSFAVQAEQLEWLESELQAAASDGLVSVLLLHCYPSDLKQGGERLKLLIAQYNVRLVEMGHTHYNELANDGRTLYAATRSIGQIEEGPVGFAVLNLDGGVVSWKYFEPGQTAAVMVTSPADERLLMENFKRAGIPVGLVHGSASIRAAVWSACRVVSMTAAVAGINVPLARIGSSTVWECLIEEGGLPTGIHRLQVTATFEDGSTAEDVVRIVVGAEALPARSRASVDQENTIEPWEERGLLGTQLGPNKNGRKW